ncbi:hypothetical protein BFJ63_vAg11091 [Fusarium oxysporum f. sp. narcissi]|uniref:Uncharacterized protein n=2 Tax=Fusarium oxysporum TaxID=5507 RepID=A0A4Q2VEA7_FUSOX|nr:hypothetical protein BFJ65_g16348 [Fusarium oxysporum f. sp. cepae]RKK31401.1 hypothetical protein BFJ66_g15880 [Fusarium oxysporum f. sp. cepae]RKK31705.1 hypothetical protein BFJ67_g15105 [Fusarium oxysporum f. sp. cepae]RYC86065.1 hypothetical protein BFJ63_vAg11091 [Fusarium oxysporum f. sp. narcissi]
MATPTSQEPSQLSPEQMQLYETIRHFLYTRKRDVRMPAVAKTVLEVSIQKHMAKYELEFLDNDERLHVALPLKVCGEDSYEVYLSLKEMRDAVEKANLSTFFHSDETQLSRKMIQMTQVRIPQLQNLNATTGKEGERIKAEQRQLEIHEKAIA